MDKKLGYMFFPQDWWSSDVYADHLPEFRYIYLELISKLYMNGNKWKVTKDRIRMLTRIDPSEKTMSELAELFQIDSEGVWSSDKIEKRILSKSERSRIASENGAKGGAQIGNQNARKKNDSKTTKNDYPTESFPLLVSQSADTLSEETSKQAKNKLKVKQSKVSINKEINKESFEEEKPISFSEQEIEANNIQNKFDILKAVDTSIFTKRQGFHALAFQYFLEKRPEWYPTSIKELDQFKFIKQIIWNMIKNKDSNFKINDYVCYQIWKDIVDVSLKEKYYQSLNLISLSNKIGELIPKVKEYRKEKSQISERKKKYEKYNGK